MKNFYLKVDFGIWWPIYLPYKKHGLTESAHKNYKNLNSPKNCVKGNLIFIESSACHVQTVNVISG